MFFDLFCFLPSLIFLNSNEYAYGFKLFRWFYFGRITTGISLLVNLMRKRKILNEGKAKMIASIIIFTLIISTVLHNLACTYLWLGFQRYDKRYS